MGVLVIFNIALTADQLEIVGLGLGAVKAKLAETEQAVQAQINAQIAAAKEAASAPSVSPPKKPRRTKKD